MRRGKQKVFRNLFSIQLGDNYQLVIEQAINSVTAMIVLIGKQWLTIRERGAKQRRLDEPKNYVRLEIEVVLQADINVIPVRSMERNRFRLNNCHPHLGAWKSFKHLLFLGTRISKRSKIESNNLRRHD
jgi:hypothetical protein